MMSMILGGWVGLVGGGSLVRSVRSRQVCSTPFLYWPDWSSSPV